MGLFLFVFNGTSSYPFETPHLGCIYEPVVSWTPTISLLFFFFFVFFLLLLIICLEAGFSGGYEPQVFSLRTSVVHPLGLWEISLILSY